MSANLSVKCRTFSVRILWETKTAKAIQTKISWAGFVRSRDGLFRYAKDFCPSNLERMTKANRLVEKFYDWCSVIKKHGKCLTFWLLNVYTLHSTIGSFLNNFWYNKILALNSHFSFHFKWMKKINYGKSNAWPRSRTWVGNHFVFSFLVSLWFVRWRQQRVFRTTTIPCKQSIYQILGFLSFVWFWSCDAGEASMFVEICLYVYNAVGPSTILEADNHRVSCVLATNHPI